MVIADRNGLAGIGFQGFNVAAEDRSDDLFLELGFFFRELGFSVVVFVFVGVGETGGVEEEIFEALIEEGGREGILWADLESSHQGLEEKVVEIGGAVE
ncbi:hypothetical protein U1Q18_008432 [Sarracenia purpurea var. burkii]